jgi:hypothetical protein
MMAGFLGNARSTGIIQFSITISDRQLKCGIGPSGKTGDWRKAKKALESSTFHAPHPFRQQKELAEGGLFPEENTDFWLFQPPFGGGG